jgi:Domain of unknown function (DUF1917)
MAVKKATSRKRSTTKRAKTTRSATKRTTRAKSAAKPEPAVEMPIEASTIELSGPAEPAAAVPAAAARAPTATASATDDRPSHERPSRFTDDYYLHATGPQRVEGLVRRPGKWMIFVSRSRVDALWETIRRAVKAGRLGHAAKVSTALPSPQSPDPKKHVICVYTADENDPADVRRVREVLRGLGITWKIPYKSDAATRAGQHEVSGGPAAKYYE